VRRRRSKRLMARPKRARLRTADRLSRSWSAPPASRKLGKPHLGPAGLLPVSAPGTADLSGLGGGHGGARGVTAFGDCVTTSPAGVIRASDNARYRSDTFVDLYRVK